MRSLYLRIYATVLAVLLLFSLVGGWIVHEQIERRAAEVRERVENRFQQRSAAWAELIEESLPRGTASPAAQRRAVVDWSRRLGIPLALDDASGQRIVTASGVPGEALRWLAFEMHDRRTLWLGLKPARKGGFGDRDGHGDGRDGRNAAFGQGDPGELDQHGPSMRRDTSSGGPLPLVSIHPANKASISSGPALGPQAALPPAPLRTPALLPPGPIPGLDSTLNLLVMMLALFAAVALGAWPAVRSLTRRLEHLKAGVQNFGQGDLSVRVPVHGHDEVAALATSFNQAAQQVENLVQAHRSLLANASHELRSPLARMKMALAMLPGASSEAQAQLSQEINTDIGELDALVEEVLLSSRLDAGAVPAAPAPVLLGGLFDGVLERAGLAQDTLEIAPPLTGSTALLAQERLLQRAVRNLIENAQRYGRRDAVAPDPDAVRVRVSAAPQAGMIHIDVLDRGPGVPPGLRERIFEAFYRLPGHAEHAGGVGLGLALVRQIAQRQGAQVLCLARAEVADGGGAPGSCFRLVWPLAPPGAGGEPPEAAHQAQRPG